MSTFSSTLLSAGVSAATSAVVPTPSATIPSNSSAPASTTIVAGSDPSVDVEQLVFHIDLVLFALFAAFCLFTLPRAIASLSHPSHFFGGIFLRGPGANESVPSLTRDFGSTRQSPKRNASSKTTRSMGRTEESHTLGSHAHLLTLPRQGSQDSSSFHVPTRVPTWATLTHPAAVSVINYPVLPGLTFIKAFALITIFGVLCYAGFYQSNPFTDPERSGYIAAAIFPIVVGLTCKNNVFSWFSGVGYEKLNYLHRFAGLMTVLAANVHGVGYIYQWALEGVFYTKLQKPRYQWAFVALGAVDLVFLSSREIVRRKSYTFFLMSHILGFLIAALAIANHEDFTIPYIAAGVIVYALDRVLRIARTRIQTAYLTPLASLNCGTTHVHVPGLTRGFRAGQHVRVRVVDGQGFFAWIGAFAFSRARPFSVASRPNGSGLELLIKKESGAFTSRLYDMAMDGPSGRSEKAKDPSQAEMGLPTRKVRLIIEGPYGGPTYTMFESYSGVLLVAGGSGISHVMSILDDLLAKHAAGQSRVRAVEVVWTVADPSSLTALLPALRPLLRPRPSPHSALSIRLTVHYTRAPRGPLPDPARLPMGLHLKAGRLNALRAIEGTVDRVLSVSSHARGAPPTSGVVVACCGPPDLVEQTRSAVGNVSWDRWRDVGGVESVSETFGW